MSTAGVFGVALLVLVVAPAFALNGRALSLRLPLWIAAVGAALATAAAVTIVAGGSTVDLGLWSPAPYAHLALRLDPLGATFAVIIGGAAVFASIYGTAYSHPRRVDDAIYPLFILAMLVVTAAANVFTFLVAWEGMALTSFLLVLGDGDQSSRRHAAVLYLGMTHIATVLAAAAFFLVAHQAGSTDFAAMAGAHLSAVRASIIFVLAVLGFGTKAGLVPFHIWLPRAHPVAPSHVSALMSGAMVKTGIYGIVRVSFVLLGPGEHWWGIALVVAGSVSAILGVLYALMEHDFKRILAYSTVENVGIITIGLGTALIFRSYGLNTAAAAALLAALIHSVNHAAFKTLLFLGAGAVQRSAHTLNIDRCGGLIHAMPATGAAVLVGSLAIAGLPPFNGFVGEWMLLRSLVSLAGSPVGSIAGATAVLALAGLALVGGLALACFVRLFGITFLGVARSTEAANAREVHPLMYGVLAALAVLCLAGGAAAPALVRLLRPVATSLLGARGAAVEPWHGIALDSGGSLSPAVICLCLVVAAPLPWLLIRAIFGKTGRASGPVWSTGVAFRPSMQYTGVSFSKPIRLFFRRVLFPERQVLVSYHGTSPLPKLVRYSGRVPALFEERFYLPARGAAIWSAGRIRLLQNGSVQVYLLYLMAALVALLVVAR
jgi:hydrogenase-4 component B